MKTLEREKACGMWPIPANQGVPVQEQPWRCLGCKCPIWVWKVRAWVCYNCKLYRIIYDASGEDPRTLDDCPASGVSKAREIVVSRYAPVHPCYHCLNKNWVFDVTMGNWRCDYCYPCGVYEPWTALRARQAGSRGRHEHVREEVER